MTTRTAIVTQEIWDAFMTGDSEWSQAFQALNAATTIPAGPVKRIYVDAPQMRLGKPGWVIKHGDTFEIASRWQIDDCTTGQQSATPLHEDGPKLWVETACAVTFWCDTVPETAPPFEAS